MTKICTIVFCVLSFLAIGQAEYAVSNIPLELRANANSVLVDEYIEVDVSEEKKMVFTSHQALTVLNRKGDDRVNTYVFFDDVTHVKEAEVLVYDSKGKEIQHYKKRDFKDVSATDGYSIYTDNRILYFDYIPVSYPYTLVFNHKYETSSTAFVSEWLPIGNYVSSTKKSIYKIIFNPNNKPRFLASNLEGFNISISENPNSFVFEAENLPAIAYEDLSKPFPKIAPIIRVALDRFYLEGVSGSGKNWEEFGSWMQNRLLYDVSDLSEGTKEMARNLVAGETTNEGKARIIYQYLQEKVRYISVQIGIGGWKPMLASDVDKLAYGDCKALTNYTKALLDAVDVPSYYTILWAGNDEVDIIKDFPSMQGNHAILGVPDGEEIHWLECTEQDKPFGFTGNSTDDRDVLVITPEGGKIVHTKAYPDEENLQVYKASVRINADGGISGSLEGKYEGLQYDGKYYWDKKTDKEQTIYYKERWSYINGLSIESKSFNDNKKDIIFTEDLKIKAVNYASNVGDDLLLCPNVFNRSQYIPTRNVDRVQDLYISEGYKDIDEVDIFIPDNFSIDSLPEKTTIETKFGSYSIAITDIEKNKISFSRTLIIKKGTFPPEEYKAYRTFRKKIAKLDKSKILLKRKTT